MLLQPYESMKHMKVYRNKWNDEWTKWVEKVWIVELKCWNRIECGKDRQQEAMKSGGEAMKLWSACFIT